MDGTTQGSGGEGQSLVQPQDHCEHSDVLLGMQTKDELRLLPTADALGG